MDQRGGPKKDFGNPDPTKTDEVEVAPSVAQGGAPPLRASRKQEKLNSNSTDRLLNGVPWCGGRNTQKVEGMCF